MGLRTKLGASAGALALASAALLAPSQNGVEQVKQHEALRTAVYLDPVGIPTICYGSTGTDVYMGMPKATQAECEVRLRKDLDVAVQGVRAAVQVPMTQIQFDALVSFTYNVGVPKMKSSTLVRLANAGQCIEAGAQFDRWVYAKGKRLPGLVKRRAAERAEWDKGCASW